MNDPFDDPKSVLGPHGCVVKIVIEKKHERGGSLYLVNGRMLKTASEIISSYGMMVGNMCKTFQVGDKMEILLRTTPKTGETDG